MVLTGFRGAGKTAVGKMLSEALEVPFIDTDSEIEERTGRKIPAIFEESGEEAFREIESRVIASLPKSDLVVATGGGAVLFDENVRNMKENSIVVFLDVSADVSYERTCRGNRPPLTNKDPKDEIEFLISKRRPAYIRSSDFCTDASGSPAEVSGRVLEIVRPGEEKAVSRAQAAEKIVSSGGGIPDYYVCSASGFLLENPNGILCAIAGNPCLHSKSPVIYNSLFEKCGICGHYTYLWKDNADDVIKAINSLGMRGVSVTIPFKEDVLPNLDYVDGHAESIGAVNTIVSSCGGLYGYNTDWLGVKRPLENMGDFGKKAVVLGTGGASRACIYALISLGMEVYVLGRDASKARALSENFGCLYGSFDDFDSICPDVLVNATPVGMEEFKGTIIKKEQLKEDMIVFDLVYTPAETELLVNAGSLGCRTIAGTEMFVYQAVEQFYLITGVRVDADLVRELVL
ncbi:shikimate dehydrogenase [Methanoplanus sp. FWC-SCC4]|uniref:Shikimate dehydrogenase (NADP(+)) n=1 Tax=Methanochimaera problematica TaxID=2609417 RepID=A0AA97I402_9EURY|nr:shikimate dehydrogenase [Methanoplanus sp. FWC-SCC4]WOF17218.1 shikimate dehydrogenase [Methanoplanus sp. FWC-SCC4]